VRGVPRYTVPNPHIGDEKKTNTSNSEATAKIMERIQKLLALSTSPNTNEAANAAAKAQELLDIHNLSMEQVATHEANGVPFGLAITSSHHTYGPINSTMDQAWQWLMAMLSEQHHCQTFVGSKFDRHTGKTLAVFTVVGEPVNVQATIALFDWLKVQLEAEADTQPPIYWERTSTPPRGTYASILRQGSYPSSTQSFRINFVYGATNEFQRVMRQRRRDSGNEATVSTLAVNHRAAVDEYLAKFLNVAKRDYDTGAINSDRLAQRMDKETAARLERSGRTLASVD
jgi:hypothetical protein